jgi:hypothetical protein
VNQSINDDDETWMLTNDFGDRSLRIWLEVLSILERNNNVWKCTMEGIRAIARKVRQSVATVQRVVGWMLAKGWLATHQQVVDSSSVLLGSPKYSFYHKTGETDWRFIGSPLPYFLPYFCPKKDNSASPSLSAGPKKSKLNPIIKEVSDRIYARDHVRYRNMIQWINMHIADYEAQDIASCLKVLEKNELDSGPLDNWWAYLQAGKEGYRLIDKLRKERLERESQEHKKAEAHPRLLHLADGIGKKI